MGIRVRAGAAAAWTVLVFLLFLVSIAGAQIPLPSAGGDGSAAISIPEDLRSVDVDVLVARIPDVQARLLLLQELRRRAVDQDAGAGGAFGGFGVALVQLRIGLEGFSDTLWSQLSTLGAGLGMVPGELATALDTVFDGQGWSGAAIMLFLLAVHLAVGWGVHAGARRGLADGRKRIEAAQPEGAIARLCWALFRALFDLLPMIAFGAATFALTSILVADAGAARTFVVTYVTAALIILLAQLAARLVLAPETPNLRLLPIDDSAARFLHRWLLRLAVLNTMAWMTAGLVILTGMAMEAHLVVVIFTGSLTMALIVAMILAARQPVASWIRGSATAGAGNAATVSPLRAQIADRWHWIALAYLGGVWLVWDASMLARAGSTIWPAIVSLIVVALLPVIDRALCGMLADMVGDPSDAFDDEDHRFLRVLRQGGRGAIAGVAAVVLLQVWGVDVLGIPGDQLRSILWSAAFDISLTMLVAYGAWTLMAAAIDRRLRTREVDGVAVAPNDRLRTLLPLARKSLRAVMLVLVTMIVLSSLGVDIGPLLAGAGVLGLAIGFGAQALVKDVVSGVFFLIDDAFRVGEYIEMGEIRGEVEAISLRSLRLRHHRGAIHTIPFGELRSITNYNRDWVIYKMKVRVPYDTDLVKVKKIIKQIGKELMDDPEVGHNFIDPLKSQGVFEMEDSAMVMRVKFTCKPREQFVIRRMAYQKIQEMFAENGIRFAHRQVTVHVPPGPEERPTVIPRGAAAAIRAEDEPSAAAF